MTTSTATIAKPEPATGTVATGTVATGTVAATGTLTVYVPQSTWSYLTGDDQGDPSALAAQVHDYIRCSLVPEANKIMNYMCPDAGTQFTPDPFRPGRDADRHGFSVRG